jgi:hypothetical protein
MLAQEIFNKWRNSGFETRIDLAAEYNVKVASGADPAFVRGFTIVSLAHDSARVYNEEYRRVQCASLDRVLRAAEGSYRCGDQ